jgi:uncharacterized membrane protein YdfJ with MMPL/SSD domain
LLVLVLESKVEGLRGEVPDYVGEVTTPIAEESLLFGDANEAIYHTCEAIQFVLTLLTLTFMYINPVSNISTMAAKGWATVLSLACLTPVLGSAASVTIKETIFLL